MGIMTRLTRLCKADLHGVMDQVEDKGLILKQCLREMETALIQKRAQLSKLTASLESVQEEYRKYQREREAVEQDIHAAIEKNKDDIARRLIKKGKTMEQHMNALDEHGSRLERRIANIQAAFETQQQAYDRLQLRTDTYLERGESRTWEDAVPGRVLESAVTDCSEEEIELELIKRKEFLKGGA